MRICVWFATIPAIFGVATLAGACNGQVVTEDILPEPDASVSSSQTLSSLPSGGSSSASATSESSASASTSHATPTSASWTRATSTRATSTEVTSTSRASSTEVTSASLTSSSWSHHHSSWTSASSTLWTTVTATSHTTRKSSTATTVTHSGSTYTTASSSTIAPECFPHPLTGFTPMPDLPAVSTTACTTTEMAAAGDCLAGVGDASAECTDAFGTTYQNACYLCVMTPETATAWGPFVELSIPTAAGSSATTELDMYNVGGCIAAEDSSPVGQSCATAQDELVECEVAACLAYCPVASYTDTAGMTALFGDGTTANPGCMGNADSAVCLSYVNAANTACSSYVGADGGVVSGSAMDTCTTIMNNMETVSPTAASFEAYMSPFCGG